WVNQGGTYKVEHAGSYMWSPLREKDGTRSQAYENMKEVCPGDFIFSHFEGHIGAIGTALSYSEAYPRPEEFPDHQNKGNREGWKISIEYRHDIRKFSPKDHFDELKPLLPSKYSPLASDKKASQKMYLSRISPELAKKLMDLMNLTPTDFPPAENVDTLASDRPLKPGDAEELKQIEFNQEIDETTRLALIESRRGQGLFRRRVCRLEKYCRVSGIKNPSFLVASHIKPWRESTNLERLDGDNGLLLSPNIDRLFDRNFISFSAAGGLLVSPLLTPEERIQFGLDQIVTVGEFTEGQRQYLAYHRGRLKGLPS
ncbi:MAG: HNH endonuclease, partial [Bdellovibrionales bacterium]|nr:HNH endonuclease [Bdellovibrionales bacterium]